MIIVGNIVGGDNTQNLEDVVLYKEQNLSKEQQAQVRENIGIVQPDWNQNDETAQDYIKNRICYDESYVLLEKTTIDFNDDGGGFVQVDYSLEDGKLYTVVIDDIYTYDAIAQKVELYGDSAIFLGDVGSFIEGLDINYIPFVMMYDPGDTESDKGTIMIELFDPATYDPISGSIDILVGSHSLSIICNDTKKIDKKFLPITNWNSNSNDEGYILNRPVYKTTKEFVWLDEITIDPENQKVTFNSFNEGWANVENVKVIFNDVECQSMISIEKDAASSADLGCKCRVIINSYEPGTSDVNEMIFGIMAWLTGKEETLKGFMGFDKPGTYKIILTITEYKTIPYEYENKALYLGEDFANIDTINDIVDALHVGNKVYGRYDGRDVEIYYASYVHEAPSTYTLKCKTLDGLKNYIIQYEQEYNDGQGGWTYESSEIITAPTSALVGQSLSVKAIDDNGRPTEWEPFFPVQICTWEDDD